MLVAEKMTRKPITVKADDTLAAARKKMDAGKFRRVPVLEGDKLVGMISDRDLREYTGMLDKTKVNAVMTPKVITVTSSTMIERAARLLLRHKFGGLPVVDDGKLVGIITTSNLLKALVDMLGASEEEEFSRIDLMVDAEMDRMLSATQVVGEAIGEILGLGTYRTESEESPVFYLRVPADDAHRAAEALRENGFEVLAVHS